MPASPSQPVSSVKKTKAEKRSFMLAGTKNGLQKIYDDGKTEILWSEGSVSKIIKAEFTGDSGENSTRWFFLSTKGIVSTSDLQNFEYRNEGLPFLTIKLYDGKKTSFEKQPAQLKDLAIHPEKPNILVTATKDSVYITYDGGKKWSSIGQMSQTTNGIKAVAVANMNKPKSGKPAVKDASGNVVTPAVAPQSDLVVFMSHSICGFSYCYPKLGNSKPAWNDVSAGFEIIKTYSYPDEISDIMPVVFMGSDGFPVTEVFVSQTFIPRLYRFDWNEKRAKLLFAGTEPADTIDGLFWNGSKVIYSRPGEIAAYNPTLNKQDFTPPEILEWKKLFNRIDDEDTLYSAWIPNAADPTKGVCLNELWLLYPETYDNKYAEKIDKKKAIYVPPHRIVIDGADKYKNIIRNNKLNAIVVDMKDDYGYLHFKPKDSLLQKKGKVSDSYAVDLDTFVPKMKDAGIYLIARIVSFKDRSLSRYDQKQYAVWDKTTNAPWRGIQGYKEDGSVKYYDEDWVDEYSPEVWEYLIHVAKELVSRGFDEIQFDYIRFPTDGRNLGNATFRWKSEGMDKESALLSFLRYARENIDAPIGIDIYGANGWYRSGTRTGQDVEQFAEYIDVVCPMFYPSHFGQSDSNYAPYSERPYRIYYYGTYRNTVIGRKKIVVRPWAQAFYLNVSYDRAYYNQNYVIQQIYGVRDSVDSGYMYWNQSCRYDDISPDVGVKQYAGPSFEASPKYRKPALSGGKREFNGNKMNVDEMIQSQKAADREAISRWDAVRATNEKTDREEESGTFPSLSDIRKLTLPSS
ncbi:MAG: hypothetical protein IKO57_03925 [Treponema sp.]|nr:hypothetical protein [Treponema sp.]